MKYSGKKSPSAREICVNIIWPPSISDSKITNTGYKINGFNIFKEIEGIENMSMTQSTIKWQAYLKNRILSCCISLWDYEQINLVPERIGLPCLESSCVEIRLPIPCSPSQRSLSPDCNSKLPSLWRLHIPFFTFISLRICHLKCKFLSIVFLCSLPLWARGYGSFSSMKQPRT